MDFRDLINYKALSRHLAGNDTSISRNRIPLKYKDKVNRLVKAIEGWNEKEG